MNNKGEIGETILRLLFFATVLILIWVTSPLISEVGRDIINLPQASPFLKLVMFIVVPFLFILSFYGIYKLLLSQPEEEF